MHNLKTKNMVLISMFAALTAILAQISLPLPFTPIPINLALLSVFIAGGLLSSVNSSISLVIYALLGAIGLPVFANFRGGLSILVGVSGGYIIGYIVAAFLIGEMTKRLPNKISMTILSMATGLFADYFIGTLWFMFVSNTALIPALTMCVFPFLAGDAFKIITAAFIVTRLSKIVEKL